MDLKKQRVEIAVTSLILALACYLEYVAYTTKVRTKVQGMQSMTFPKIILYVLIFLCAIVLVKGILNYIKLKKQAEPDTGKDTGNKKTFDYRIPLTVALIIMYAALWNVIGFVLSSYIFVSIESILLDHSKAWWHALLIALGYVVIVYLIFSVGFKVHFPEPILDALIG